MYKDLLAKEKIKIEELSARCLRKIDRYKKLENLNKALGGYTQPDENADSKQKSAWTRSRNAIIKNQNEMGDLDEEICDEIYSISEEKKSNPPQPPTPTVVETVKSEPEFEIPNPPKPPQPQKRTILFGLLEI